MSRSTARRFGPLVLCYHAVSDRWEHPLSVRPQAFEAQLRYLIRRGYRSVPASEVLSGRGRTLHVTFDDGFLNVSGVVDTMQRLGVRATMFACSAFAVDGRPFDGGKLAGEALRYPDELRTMTFDDLRSLAERGIEVGSHAITHPRLTELSDHELARELGRSREEFEAELGRPCLFLAYPFGDEDARVRAAARSAGYVGAFSFPGRRTPVDPYGLPRVGVYRKDGVVRTALKVSVPGRHAAAWRAGRSRSRRARTG